MAYLNKGDYRQIGGRRFTHKRSFRLKSKAKAYATKLRKKYRLVRTLKSTSRGTVRYEVYSHGRK